MPKKPSSKVTRSEPEHEHTESLADLASAGTLKAVAAYSDPMIIVC